MTGDKTIELMREITQKVMQANQLSRLLFGRVTAVSPLKIWVDNRFQLTEEFLILSPLCKRRSVKAPGHVHTLEGLSVGAYTPPAHSHSLPQEVWPEQQDETKRLTEEDRPVQHTHTIQSGVTGENAETEIVLWEGLQQGDKVCLTPFNKGQVYYVMPLA